MDISKVNSPTFELRTVLNSILGMVQITLDSDLKKEQREHLEMALSSAWRAAELLNMLSKQEASRPAPQETKPVQKTEAQRSPLKILIAEDNFINQRIVNNLLTKRGHAVCVANNGSEAVSALEASAFDIVIMDIKMPVMDGVQALQIIREREKSSRSQRTPVIALSAWDGDCPPDEGKPHRFDAYIPKPLDVTTLLDTIYDGISGSQ